MLLYPNGRRHYRESHSLRREQMDPDALKVVNRLTRNGYRGYLVGGCIRDMLLGRRPKDFDVVTNATPAQIRALFSNSRTIGRRFKIVHVLFRGKIIEISTFRSIPGHRLSGEKETDLLMRRDNQFGTPREDAARRDFTINALYFDPRNESIIDYVGGVEDIENRRISVIGDPEMSFKEDPVRMLRAAKFAALLNFELDQKCEKAIKKCKHEITKASTSRMLEEYSKIFRTGKTSVIFNSLARTELLKVLFPESWSVIDNGSATENFLDTSMGKKLVIADRMLTEREDLTTNIYMALVLGDLVKDIFSGKETQNTIEYIKEKIYPTCHRLNISGKDRDRLLQIYASQNRFTKINLQKAKQDFFRKKIYFYEAFALYKINTIAANDEQAMQNAMYWEIGLRTHPPESGKIINLFEGRRKIDKRIRRVGKPKI